MAGAGLPLHGLSSRALHPRRRLHRSPARPATDELRRDRRPAGSTTAATGPTTASWAGVAPPSPALWRASVRRALGIRRSWRQKLFPWLLLAVVSVPAIVNVGIAYVTRDTQRRHQHHHLPRVRRRLHRAAGLRRPHRARRPLPRPPQPHAPAAVRPAVDRARLRRGQGRRHRRDRVRLRLPPPGRAVHRSDAGQRRRARLPPRQRRRALAGARRRWRSSPSTTRPSCSPSPRSRPGASSPPPRCSSSCWCRRRSRPSSAASRTSAPPQSSAWAVANLAALPLYLRDLVFEATIVAPSPLAGVSGGAALAVVVYLAVVIASIGTLLWRYRWVES